MGIQIPTYEDRTYMCTDCGERGGFTHCAEQVPPLHTARSRKVDTGACFFVCEKWQYLRGVIFGAIQTCMHLFWQSKKHNIYYTLGAYQKHGQIMTTKKAHHEITLVVVICHNPPSPPDALTGQFLCQFSWGSALSPLCMLIQINGPS